MMLFILVLRLIEGHRGAENSTLNNKLLTYASRSDIYHLPEKPARLSDKQAVSRCFGQIISRTWEDVQENHGFLRSFTPRILPHLDPANVPNSFCRGSDPKADQERPASVLEPLYYMYDAGNCNESNEDQIDGL
jgi:hypothetical protein